jgi:hypothetical protein
VDDAAIPSKGARCSHDLIRSEGVERLRF